jgi:hypothetical protein
LAARPLIVSNLGGMAEKVDPTVDRVFAARSPSALAGLMAELVRAQPQSQARRLNALAQARIQEDETHLARHQAVYQELVAAPRDPIDSTGPGGLY